MLIPIGDEQETTVVPFINYALIIVNVIAFFVLALRPDYGDIVRNYGTIPADLKPWTLVTSAFLHAGVFHLAGNMLFLWIFGDNIEERFGHLKYLAFYLGAAAAAGLFFAVCNAGSKIPAVGASGAISACLGAYAVLFPKVKIRFFYLIYIRAGTFAVSATWAVGFWAAMQAMWFLVLKSESFAGVAYSAHIGGFLFGLAVGIPAAIFFKRTKQAQLAAMDRRLKEGRLAPAHPRPLVGPKPFVASAGSPQPLRRTPEFSPIPLAEVIHGFAVFRRTDEKINIAEVGGIVATLLKVPLAEVTSRLKACSGFVGDGLTESQAEVLSRELKQMNIPTFVVEQEKLRKLPEALLASDAAFGPQGFTVASEGRQQAFPWSDILMANAGVIEGARDVEVQITGKPRRYVGLSGYAFGARQPKTKMVRETSYRLLIDVLIGEPWCRYRIQEGYTTFSLMGEAMLPGAHQNMVKMARDIVLHGGPVLVGDAVEALAGGLSLAPFTYENRRKYDLVNFYLAHKALYD